MKVLNTVQIIKKITGDIRPSGRSEVDAERLENLKELCEVVNDLVQMIDNIVSDNEGSHEHSVKVMTTYAQDFLENTLGIS